MERYLSRAVACAALACSLPALAQSTVYKLERTDGQTVYSDKVLPQTKVKKEITASDLNLIAPLATSKEAQETDARLNSQVARRDQLWRARNTA